MSEALLGVLVGGLIASIAPITMLIIDHRRWKCESKLEYLGSERRRLETLYSDGLKRLSDAMTDNSYPSQLTSDIMILMPKSIDKRFQEWMTEPDKDELKAKHAYFDICIEMKKSLAAIDDRIREVIEE